MAPFSFLARPMRCRQSRCSTGGCAQQPVQANTTLTQETGFLKVAQGARLLSVVGMVFRFTYGIAIAMRRQTRMGMHSLSTELLRERVTTRRLQALFWSPSGLV
jgi:hypothetical protein